MSWNPAWTTQDRLRSVVAVMAAVVLVAVGSLQLMAQEGSDEVKQRFLREAPPKWEEYTRIAKDLQCIIEITSSDSINSSSHNNTVLYNTNGRCIAVHTVERSNSADKGPKYFEQIHCCNPRYSFILLRRTPDSQWALTNFAEKSDELEWGLATSMNTNVRLCMEYGIRFGYGYEPFATLVNRPEFRVGDCRTVHTDGAELVEVSFAYLMKDGNFTTPLQGKLLFDPEHYWCCRSGEIHSNGQISAGVLKLNGSLSDKDRSTIPFSQVWGFEGDWASPGGEVKNKQSRRYEVDLSRSNEKPDDADYTLSAYGLPEPDGVTSERPAPMHVWLLIGAGICVCLALLLRWLSRRRQVAQAN